MPVKEIVIVGRDAPLWLTACVLHAALGPAGLKVTVVELPSLLQPHEVYVSLPALEALHERLGIDESRLVGMTRGAFSLGQNFVDLSGAKAPSFFHAHGSYGALIDQQAFLPYWIKARGLGLQVAFEEFCLTAAAAKQGRMLLPDSAIDAYGHTDYAYHLPALAYVAWLKRLAIRRGVMTHDAQTIDTVLNPDDGSILAVEIGDGRRIDGQFFVDATGAEAQLIGKKLGVARESWRDCFPADRKLVAYGPPLASVPVYAEVRAWTDGWLGLYPSQACTHTVQTYSGSSCSDEEALQASIKLSGLTLRDAAVKFSDPGRRIAAWDRNCVAIGDAACTFDPIHSVELQAVQIGLVHLLSLFPVQDDYETERIEYNRTVSSAFERIRDFQSAHYVLNRYAPSSFWTQARQASVSAELTHKIGTFRARGDVAFYENETFMIDNWQALLIGHGVVPETYDPVIDRTPPEFIKREFTRILGFIKNKVQEQATHSFYLQSVCSPAGSE